MNSELSADDTQPLKRPAVPHGLAVGERLGVWRVAESLQGCNSGHWYRIEHAMAGEQQAAVMVYEQGEDAGAVLLRFAEEHPGLATLSHPDIALPLDSGLTASGLPYVVMQWLEGRPLLPWAMQLPLRRRLELLVQLCELLGVLHEHGQLLRELDPGMLWVSPRERLCLMAQGLAPMLPEPGEDHFGYIGAAVPLLAPELLDGHSPHLASEAYAVGVLMCLLVNGRLPGVDAQNADLQGAPVQSLAAWVSLSAAERQRLDLMLERATAASLMERYTSAQALGEDVKAWLSGQSPAPLPPMPQPLMPRSKPERSRRSRRSAPQRWLLPGLLLGLVGLAALGLWLMSQLRL